MFEDVVFFERCNLILEMCIPWMLSSGSQFMIFTVCDGTALWVAYFAITTHCYIHKFSVLECQLVRFAKVVSTGSTTPKRLAVPGQATQIERPSNIPCSSLEGYIIRMMYSGDCIIIRLYS